VVVSLSDLPNVDTAVAGKKVGSVDKDTERRVVADAAVVVVAAAARNLDREGTAETDHTVGIHQIP
jgi:hypothetical protein